jgi:hypothetical protein
MLRHIAATAATASANMNAWTLTQDSLSGHIRNATQERALRLVL